VEEISRERLGLLGPSFLSQHSDARLFEQLIDKRRHWRVVIAECLSDNYARLLESGGSVTRSEIERDVQRMFAGNLQQLVGMRSDGTRVELLSSR
jgi:hypothetical protein